MRKTLLNRASETLIISGAVFLVLTLPLVLAYPPLFASTELITAFLLRFTLIGGSFVGSGAVGILPEIMDSISDWSVVYNQAESCPNFFLDNPEDLC